MNKREAIKIIKNIELIKYSSMEFVEEIISIISQIHKLQKVKIPQLVADWLEIARRQHLSLGQAMDHWEMSEKIEKWFQYANNQEMFARAWLDGYEVEKEQLYTVEIPNPNIIGNEVNVLMKNGFKQVVIVKKFGKDWKTEKGFRLTESEIKRDFEWAWQWAKPVEVE